MFATRSFSRSYAPEDYFSMLENKKVEKLVVNPDSLKTILKDRKLYLEVEKQKTDLYPVSKVFVEKLFRWFYTSTEILPALSPESLLSVTNDLLSTIYKRGMKYPFNTVQLRIEDSVVLSILGNNYVTIEDREIYEHIGQFGVQKIIHDDHITRFISEIKIQNEAVVGDRMGYAMHFTNSQTGFGAMTRSIYILRYWCKNGAVSDQLLKKDCHYHTGGGLQGFVRSLESFSTDFGEWVSNFEVCLKEARKENYNKLMAVRVKEILSRVLTVYETKELMKTLEKSETLWQVYDVLTTRAKTFNTYQRFLLEEAAGSVISRLCSGSE